MPKIKLLYIISSILLLFWFSSCSKNSNTTPIDFGYNYYPLSVTARIYDVDSLVHNDNDDKLGVVDTFKYQVKEIIADTFVDASGEIVYKFKRYYRNNATEQWSITDVWVLRKTSTRVELTEENEKLVKLNFPIELNKTWDGNVLNGNPSQNFEYTEIDQFVNLNNINYDSSLTIVHIDNLNIIEKQFSQEQYAKNVGLILKEKIFLDFQADSGLEFRMTLVSWN